MRKYGYKKDVFDARDLIRAAANPSVAETLPSKWSNFALEAPIFDQGQTGSCTGNAWAGAFEQVLHLEGLHIFRPSRLFIYYNERVIEGTVSQDAGAQIRTGIQAITKSGVCPETMWPFNPNLLTKEPGSACYSAAIKNVGLQYKRVNQDINDFKDVIHSGDPIVIGFNVYQSFEGDAIAANGIMPMPAAGEQMIGGHAVEVGGYDDNFDNLDGSKGALYVRNSWGPDWGAKGYFWMPYKFAFDPAQVSDIWTLTKCD